MDHSCVLVFVTDQSQCVRLIRAGQGLARQLSVGLQVVAIRRSSDLSPFETKELQALANITRKLGGEMNILFHENAVLMAAITARKKHAVHIVSGLPTIGHDFFVSGTRLLIPDLPWTIVDTDGKKTTLKPLPDADPSAIIT